jgi:hypothetical protein
VDGPTLTPQPNRWIQAQRGVLSDPYSRSEVRRSRGSRCEDHLERPGHRRLVARMMLLWEETLDQVVPAG